MRSKLPESHPWHPSQVTTAKLEKLYKLVEDAADEMFERDEDNDLPIEIRLVNRAIHDTMAGYLPVRYLHHIDTQADWEEALSDLLSNVSRSIRQLETALQVRKTMVFEDEPVESKPDPLRAKVCHALGGSSTATDEQIMHNLEAMLVRARAEPKVVEKVVEVTKVPMLESPTDLSVGDQVIVLPSTDRPASVGKVVELIRSRQNFTNEQVTRWMAPAPGTTDRRLARMRDATDYDRFIIETPHPRHRGVSYLIVPRIANQISQLVLRLM